MDPFVPLAPYLCVEPISVPFQILIPLSRHSRLAPIVHAERSFDLPGKVLLDELPELADGVNVHLAAYVGEPSMPGSDMGDLIKVDNLHHLAARDVAGFLKLFDRDRVDLRAG